MNFKFLPALQGTGRLGAYVAVDHYWTPHTLPESKEMCLTAEALSAEEFTVYVDELIQELTDLKATALRKFSKQES